MRYALPRSEAAPFPAAPPVRGGRAVLLPLPPGEPLDLEATLRCGQAFRWRRHGDTWYGPLGQVSLALRQVPGGIQARCLGGELAPAQIAAFLSLDVHLASVQEQLGTDPRLRAAIGSAPGLRLLRQDPWECLVGFLCSQWSNVPRIERTLELLALRAGAVVRWGEIEPGAPDIPVLPPAAVLAELPETALRECSLGYRAAYLRSAAFQVAAGEPALPGLATLPYDEALRQLLALPGVGRKVADCVLLFALEQPAAFPVDVWVRRVLYELYPRELTSYTGCATPPGAGPPGPREHAALVRFAHDRWGALAGYAQQYLFHARRTGALSAHAGE
jgi:N-glycosylase/DNA lyase